MRTKDAKDAKAVHDAKAMAKSLRDALAVKKVSLSHGECLEIVARQFGFSDWNTLAAKLSAGTHSLAASTAPVQGAPPTGAASSSGARTPAAGATLAGIPVLPLRDVVVYPGVVIPLYAARSRTVRAMEAAMSGDKRVLVLTQRRSADDAVGADDLYRIGTFANVVEVLQLPNETWKILVGGLTRARMDALQTEPYLSAQITVLGETQTGADPQLQALRQSVSDRFEHYARGTGWPHVPGRVESDASVRTHILASFALLDDGRFADTIAAHTRLQLTEKQQVLEMLDVRARLEYVAAALVALQAEALPDSQAPQP